MKYLDCEQTQRFFDGITDRRDRALFATIYQHGLRVSEASLLQLTDIDLERDRILIRRVKNGIGGERPLLNETARLLTVYLKYRLPTGTALFTGRQGDLSPQRIQQLFKCYAQQAGLDPQVSVHSLRHSIATHLLDAGQGIEYVQDHLGHVNIENTQIYAKITDYRRAEVYRQLEHSRDIVHVESLDDTGGEP